MALQQANRPTRRTDNRSSTLSTFLQSNRPARRTDTCNNIVSMATHAKGPLRRTEKLGSVVGTNGGSTNVHDSNPGCDLPRLLGRNNMMSDQKLEYSVEQKEDVGKEMHGKGPISMLQEFVQCSKEFRMPPRQPILQWHFETRMQDHSTLEFQARANFLIAGAPHHAVGAWHPAKKAAQRDTAERALAFFVGRWGEQLVSSTVLTNEEDAASACLDTANAVSPDDIASTTSGESSDLSPSVTQANAETTDCQLLERVCRQYQGCDDAPAQVNLTYEPCDAPCGIAGHYQAFVEVDLLGVPHKFAGPKCSSEHEAYDQTIRRVLWYLQHPRYQQAFEPDTALTANSLVQQPPAWTRNASEEENLQMAERKTAVMRVQNRLQQRLAQELKPGQSVWDWTYEIDREDGGWPPLCRATVRVAVFGVEFTGDWVRSHRGAQLDACQYVSQFLDQLDSRITPAKNRSRGPA